MPYDSNDPNTLFLCKWDTSNSFDSESTNGKPSEASLKHGPHLYSVGTSVSPEFKTCARVGLETGSNLGDPSAFEYTTANHYNPKKGTIEFWFKPSVNWSLNKNSPTLFRCGNIAIWGSATPDNQWMLFEVGANRMGLKFPPELYNGTADWMHFALTYDLTDEQAGRVRFYLNGKLIKESGEFRSEGMKAAETFYIGGDGAGNFIGNMLVDEFRISAVEREYAPRN